MQKPLKSLTFPGLDDVYTIPQVDETLTIPGAAADAEKVGIALDTIDSNMFGELERIEQYASGLRVGNLLDNSYFINPINQRGITGTAGKGVYTIDRWILDSENGNGYFDVQSNCIGLNINSDSWITLSQKRNDLDRNKTYTIAFEDGNGNIYINENCDILWQEDGIAAVRIILESGNKTYKWAALYEGAYTADTLPEYLYKGYAAELAECRRYYYKLKSWGQVGAGAVDYLGASANIVVPIGTTTITIKKVY